METCPAPIIIVSASYDPRDLGKCSEWSRQGALTFLPPPLGIGHPEFRARADELIRTVKLMSEIKVVRRWPKSPRQTGTQNRSREELRNRSRSWPWGPRPEDLWSLKRFLRAWAPVFRRRCSWCSICPRALLPGWPNGCSNPPAFRCRWPKHREQILPGQAYLAPDGFHMGVDRFGRIELSTQAPVNGLRPAIAPLFGRWRNAMAPAPWASCSPAWAPTGPPNWPC